MKNSMKRMLTKILSESSMTMEIPIPTINRRIMMDTDWQENSNSTKNNLQPTT